MSSSNQSESIDGRPILPEIEDITDLKAKENVLMVMEILKSDQVDLYPEALIKIRDMIRGFNESPTLSIIPKQLILLQPFYSFFKHLYKQLIQESDRQLTADIISVLATINTRLNCDSDEDKKETLIYKLLGSPDCKLDYFGFEYVNHLTIDIVNEIQSSGPLIGDQLSKLIVSIVNYYLKSNCFTEAIDFTLDIHSLDLLIDYLDGEFSQMDDENFNDMITKIGSYLITCSSYLTGDDQIYVSSFVIKLYLKYKFWIEALIATLSTDFNQPSAIESILTSCSSSPGPESTAIIKQIACILNRQIIYLYHYSDPLVRGLMSSVKSLSLINYVAKELDCLAPYNLQSELPDFLTSSPFGLGLRVRRPPIRSIILHIANGFANIATGRDEMILSVVSSMRPQLLSTKYGADCVASIVGSIGLIYLWNPEVTFNLTLNRFSTVPGSELKAGSILACSLSRASYRGDDEEDDFLDCPEFDAIDEGTWEEQVSTIIGLGVAYSGTNNLEAIYILRRLLRSNKIPLICKGIASLSVGLIVVSSANHKVATHLVTTLTQIDSLVNRPESLVTCWFICLALGLIYLRRKDKNLSDRVDDDGESDPLIKQIDKLSSQKLRSMVKLTLDCCRYANSGNVLKIQRLLHIISDDETSDQQKQNLPSTSKTVDDQKHEPLSCKHIETKRGKRNERSKQNKKRVSIAPNDHKSTTTNSKPIRNIGKKAAGRVKRKLKVLNELNTIEEIERNVQSERGEKSPPPPTPNRLSSSNPRLIRSFKNQRRLRRYSTDRRSSLPTASTRISRVSSPSPVHSDDESHRALHGPLRTNRPRQTMNLLQSLQALNHSLDELIAESKDKGRHSSNGKANVNTLSLTPPRDIIKAIAVIGIGLIATGESVGMSMAKRVLQQILFNGPPSAKRLVPMAFALLSLSSPDQEILLTLEKYSRYQMVSLSVNSIIALGLIGSGSLDYKLSKMLSSLFDHYDAGPTCCIDALIMAKGLLHLGKGLMTLDPFSHDNQLTFPTGLAAILIIAFSSLDVKHILFGCKLNQMFYYLTPAVRTRFVVTLDETTLEPVEVPLGVGQALDTTGQVGKLRLATIASTQNSPIILKNNEKAEIKTESYKVISKSIEGTVIVTKKSDHN